jgi:FAD/FMN-containing dehydrogenase
MAIALDGSISGEHGTGATKRTELERHSDASSWRLPMNCLWEALERHAGTRAARSRCP